MKKKKKKMSCHTFCLLGEVIQDGNIENEFFVQIMISDEEWKMLQDVTDHKSQVMTVAPFHNLSRRFDVTSLEVVNAEEEIYLLKYKNPSWIGDPESDDKLFNVPISNFVCVSARVCEKEGCVL